MHSHPRRRFTVPRGFTIVAVALVAMLGGSAAPALADSVTQLPAGLNEPSMTVDPAGQHVFISGGPGASSIVVLNFDGSIATTITGEQGASQMALDSATHTLYVALDNANAISEIDTQTLKETARFSTAPFTGPYSVVIGGGKLWFAGLATPGYVATANLDGTNVASAANISIPQPVQLAAGGASDNLLATGTNASEPAGVSLYDVSSGTASPLSGPAGDPGGTPCELDDFNFDPTGTHLLFASYCQTWVAGLATDPFGTTIDYPSGSGPVAVASSSDGQYVAVATNNPSFNPLTIQVFPVGSTVPERAWDLYTGVVHAGLAFSPDGTKLFAITGGSSGHLNFQVLGRATPPTTTITTGPSGSVYANGAVFDFYSSESPLATFQCKLDGAGWTACTSPATVFPTPLIGSHTFKVRAVQGKLIDPVGATRTWTILGPDAQITSGPSASTYAPVATFKLKTKDPTVGSYYCSLDGAIWTQCWSPVTYSGLKPGSHTFRVRAIHNDGTIDDASLAATETWKVLPGGRKLDVSVQGPGLGSVTSTPAGVTRCTIFCEAWFLGGTQVTLVAAPSPGFGFSGWSGACTGTGKCIVTLNQARSVKATFVLLPTATLTVTKAGSGTGRVTSTPVGINCGTTCVHAFKSATSVTLTAKPGQGSSFTGWSGACSRTGPCVVSMYGAKKVAATFSKP